MSIMDSIRSNTDSTFMQVLLVLIVASMFFWYFGPEGQQTHAVASVNGVNIMATDLSRAFERERNFHLDQGRPLGEAEREQLREEVLQRLIRDEVLRQEAERLGITVSDSELARERLRNENFHVDGRYDPRQFENQIRRWGLTRSAYESQTRDRLLRRKLRSLVSQGGHVTDASLVRTYVDMNTLFDLEFVRVAPDALEPAAPIADARVQAFIDEEGERIGEAYRADFEQLYNIPEQVELRVIRLEVTEDGLGTEDLAARLRELREQIEGGASFADLAARWSEHPSAERGGSLGLEPLDGLPYEVTDHVADLQTGELSELLIEEDQVRLFQVDDRLQAREIPLEEVREDIARRLIWEEDAPDVARSIADEVHEAWDQTGEPPVELLVEHGLELDATGTLPVQTEGYPGGPPQGFLELARQQEAEGLLPEPHEEDGVIWLGSIQEWVDADMDEFDEQRMLMEQQVRASKRGILWSAWVEEAMARARVQ